MVMPIHTPTQNLTPSPLKPLCASIVAICGAMLLTSGCSHAPTRSAKLRVQPAYSVQDGGRVDRSYGYIARARELEKDNAHAEALVWWRKATEVAPERADAHQGLGLCLARQGQLEDGVAALRTARKLRPNDPVILNNLGFALKLVGQSQSAEARELFERAIAVDPGYDRARYNLAQLAAPGMSMRLSPAPQAVGPSAPTAPAAPALAAATPNPAPVVSLTGGPLLAVQLAPNAPELRTLSAPPQPVAVQLAPSKPAVAQVADAPLSLTPSVTLAGVAVEVFNGNGIAGAARKVRQNLAMQGVVAQRVANMRGFGANMTRVVYAPGRAAEARQLATLLAVSAELAEASPQEARSMRADLRVVLGHNFRGSRLAMGTLDASDAPEVL